MNKKEVLKEFDKFLEANEIHFVNPIKNEDKNLILDFIFYVVLKAQREKIIRKLKKIQENPDKLRKRLASDIYKKERGKKGEAFNKAHDISIYQFPYNLAIDKAIKIIKSLK